MGRKKKKEAKPWCFYCQREFEDELVLVNHQKAKHFKCHLCSRRLYTGPALVIHCMHVHKEEVKEIPNSLPGREDPKINIYGSEGIPDWAQQDFRAFKGQRVSCSLPLGTSAKCFPPVVILRCPPLISQLFSGVL